MSHPIVLQLAIALEDGTRVIAQLGAEVRADPCARTLDALLAQCRGVTMLALRAHREIADSPTPPTTRGPLASKAA